MLALLLLPLPRPAAAAGFADLAGHWAEVEVNQAVALGWANGYPDGQFRPQGAITRAEFVKLLAAATGLHPEGETAKALVAAAAPHVGPDPGSTLADLQEHWLATQGWLKPAVAFGLIIPGDYEGRFEPNRPITRQEIAIMTVRALGRVYPALYEEAGDLGFADQESLQAWARGYVKQAVLAGVLKGYPDGTFGAGRQATRAEAVVMVRRTVAAMTEGADPAIKISVKVQREREPYPVTLATPALFVDGRIYVPARSVYTAIRMLRVEAPAFTWDPVRQQLTHILSVTAGSETVVQKLKLASLEWQLAAPARIAFGELMLPVRLATPEGSPFYQTGTLFWEAEQKHLIIYAAEEYEASAP